MYYPIGLPKKLKVASNDANVKTVVCNKDRNLFCILTEHSIWIWYSRVSLPIFNNLVKPY